MTIWTIENQIQSQKQGWGLFDSVGAVCQLQLQKDDERDLFKNDADAWEFVGDRAKNYDDSLAIKALKVLSEEDNPVEYRDIIKFTTD